MKRISLSLLFVLFQYVLNAFTLTGYIYDKAGFSLPFVNVMIKGTTKGCISNENGYYSLDLSSGDYEIIYRYIGYAQQIQKVKIEGKNVKLNITMSKTTLDLKEVVIDGNAEDPAYRVIREAQKKRKYYLEQVNAYSCDVYIKSLVRFCENPEKPDSLWGPTTAIWDNVTIVIDADTIITNLSESVSKFNFQQPDKIKEEMVSSKVHGSVMNFSENQVSVFNFYKNSLDVEGLSERELISPISSGAFLYYRYKLEGAFMENGLLVNKIQVIPKRKNDPVFRGHIYIIDNTWNIHSVDLYITKDARIDFVDSLSIQQIYSHIEDDIWMPVSTKFSFVFDGIWYKENGYFLNIQNNYVLNPDFPKGFFGPEKMKINDDANKKDSIYWKKTQPVSLTVEEKKDYRFMDSLVAIANTKEYKDSLDKENNYFSIGTFILSGYKYHDSYKNYDINFNFGIPCLNYNTVEGWVLNPSVNYYKKFDNNKHYHIGGDIRYGFGNTHFNGNVWASHYFNPQHFSSVSFSAGKNVMQFDSWAMSQTTSMYTLFNIYNSIYTLLLEQNYMKLYENQYANINYSTKLKNGIYFNADCSYNDRIPLNNSKTWTIKDYPEKHFTSNNPQYADSVGYSFNRNRGVLADIGLRFCIRQKYYTSPNKKVILGSKYPEFRINYKKGLGDVNFDLIKAGISKEIKIKFIGVFKFDVSCGSFLNKKKLYFMDYNHIHGNQTIFMNSINNENNTIKAGYLYETTILMGFNLLPYYKYSTTSNFIEAHAEHHFNGWFINKIPLLRKTRFQEVAGIHYLSSKEINQYVEVAVGVEKIGIPGVIPSFLRIDFITAFNSNTKINNGFRIGIGF